MKVLLYVLLLVSMPAVAQTGNNTSLYARLSSPPVFKGDPSTRDLYQFLRNHMRYPDLARETGTEGKVIVRFWIDEKGMVKDAEVLRGIGFGCDAEALRVVRRMPPWKPAYYRKRPVRVAYVLPIDFRFDR